MSASARPAGSSSCPTTKPRPLPPRARRGPRRGARVDRACFRRRARVSPSSRYCDAPLRRDDRRRRLSPPATAASLARAASKRRVRTPAPNARERAACARRPARSRGRPAVPRSSLQGQSPTAGARARATCPAFRLATGSMNSPSGGTSASRWPSAPLCSSDRPHAAVSHELRSLLGQRWPGRENSRLLRESARRRRSCPRPPSSQSSSSRAEGSCRSVLNGLLSEARTCGRGAAIVVALPGECIARKRVLPVERVHVIRRELRHVWSNRPHSRRFLTVSICANGKEARPAPSDHLVNGWRGEQRRLRTSASARDSPPASAPPAI